MSSRMSVVICAYTERRWDDLCAAVASVTSQLEPGDECIVVIDHNERLLVRAHTKFTAMRVHVVASFGAKGLSGARNSGVAVAAGEFVGFLDDDAVAGPGWVAALRQGLSEMDVAGVGSAVTPKWPTGSRPSWFPPEFDWVVGCTYLGLPREAADVRNVIGAGMAFRRDVVELAGGFSEEVGRVGTTPTGCEETELCIRIRQAKPQLRVRFLPSVEVRHTVDPERVNARYFLRRCLGEGRSKARVAGLVGNDAALESEKSYVRRVLPRGFLRELGRAGFAAAGLMLLGVAAAGLGYLQGKLRRGGPL